MFFLRTNISENDIGKPKILNNKQLCDAKVVDSFLFCFLSSFRSFNYVDSKAIAKSNIKRIQISKKSDSFNQEKKQRKNC